MGLGNIDKYMDENNYGKSIEETDFFEHPEMEIKEEFVADKKAKTSNIVDLPLPLGPRKTVNGVMPFNSRSCNAL